MKISKKVKVFGLAAVMVFAVGAVAYGVSYRTGAQSTIEEKVVSTYKKIEDSVVSGYMKIQDGAVSGYEKVESSFVDTTSEDDE